MYVFLLYFWWKIRCLPLKLQPTSASASYRHDSYVANLLLWLSGTVRPGQAFVRYEYLLLHWVNRKRTKKHQSDTSDTSTRTLLTVRLNVVLRAV